MVLILERIRSEPGHEEKRNYWKRTFNGRDKVGFTDLILNQIRIQLPDSSADIVFLKRTSEGASDHYTP